MTTLHATGTSEAHYTAQRATITAHISISSEQRSKSIEQATSLHNQLVRQAEMLRDSGDATWHMASPISTWARNSYPHGMQSPSVLEHVTSSSVRIKLSNLALVSETVTQLSTMGAETSVNWSLTEAFLRECERAARTQAVAEARKIAEDYAAALGEKVVSVTSISDSPTNNFGGPQPRFAVAAEMGAAAEVTVAEITVSATVAGVFESAR